MRTMFLLVLWTLAVPAFGGETASAYNATRLKELRSIGFDHVASVRVAKIHDSENAAQNVRSSFHRYAATTEWQRVTLTDAEPLTRLLSEVIDSWVDAYAKAGDSDVVELSSFCVPHPGYGIWLQTKSGRRDFAICLECGEMYVFGKTKKAVVVHLSEQETALLRKYYSAELR